MGDYLSTNLIFL